MFQESLKCLDDSVASILYQNSLRACSGDDSISTIVYINGLLFFLPTSQLPEAWANLLHVFCYRDYEYYPGFSPLNGWIVVDVGGFLGFYTVYAASRVGSKGRVVVVEPNPYVREYLYQNISANCLSGRVEVEPRALLADNMALKLYIGCYWANTSMHRAYVENGPGICGTITVPAIGLGTLIHEHKLPRIDLLKIDVEGAEKRLLIENNDILSSGFVKRIVVELHEGYGSVDEIIDLLENYSFKVFVYKPKDYGQAFIYGISLI